MKTLLAILATVLALAAVSGSEAASHTYISNWSSRQIRATTSYSPGESKFRERLIEPYTWDVDEYVVLGTINVEMWIEGFTYHNWFTLDSDRSIVTFDSGPIVEIFLAKPGKLIVKDDSHPEKLATIIPQNE